jgi:hypothetical protein
MYKMGKYFVEVLPERLSVEAWSAIVRFSIADDYRQHAEVPTAVFQSHIVDSRREAIERRVVQWARQLVNDESEVIDSALHPPDCQVRRLRC